MEFEGHYVSSLTTRKQNVFGTHSEPNSIRGKSPSPWDPLLNTWASRKTKSCRSEMNLTEMNIHNRDKLIEAFLPDLRRQHIRMGFTHRVRPFNLNQEKLKTVQIRAKTASYDRDLREHSDISLGLGRKAANNTTPNATWAVKPLPVNTANDRLCPDDSPRLLAFVKRQHWNYSDGRLMLKRPLPKRSCDK